MYDQLLSLKQNVHSIKQENFLLKSKLYQLQLAKAKKNQVMRELQLRIKNPGLQGHLTKENPYLLASLKSKHIEVRRENVKLRKELREFQRDKKLTYINELEGEQRAYTEEVERLEELIESIENEAKYNREEGVKSKTKVQEDSIIKAKEEQKAIATELEECEKEIEQHKRTFEENNKVNENRLKEHDKEIEKYQKRIEEMEKNKSEGVSKAEIEKLKNAKEEEKAKVKQQQKRIAELKNSIQNAEANKEAEFDSLKKKGKKAVTEDKKMPCPVKVVDKLTNKFKQQSITAKDLKNRLFERIEIDEGVTVHELSRIFTRQPCELTIEEGTQLAEFIIRNKVDIENKKLPIIMRERTLLDILEELSMLIMSPQNIHEGNSEESRNIESVKIPSSDQISPLDEERAANIFQDCFIKICNELEKKNKTVEELFSSIGDTKAINGEKKKVIAPKDFLKIIEQKLNLKFDNIEGTCLTKVLAASEEDEFIKLEDIAQIVSDIKANKDDPDKVNLNFNDLDETSMVLLFALTEYMMSSKVAFYSLFENYIYKQDVEVEDEQMTVDLINSNDFFKVMEEIGIGLNENEHENLKLFLCIDPEYPNKLMANKLKKAIEEFAVNEDLREKAYDHYKVLAEDAVSNEDNHNDKKSNRSL